MHRIIALIGIVFCFGITGLITNLAINKRVVSNYFGNIAFAYEDYGFPYCFSASVFNTGISQPNNYSKETIEQISNEDYRGNNRQKRDAEYYFYSAGIFL